MTTNSFTKICLFLFIGMTVAIRPAFSNPVSRSQALQNARNFIQKRGGNIKKMALRQAPLKSNEAENAPYYIFNLGDDNGFVIASGDDRAHAILGYSDEGAIDVNKMPDAMKYMLDYYEEQIQLSKNLTNSEVTNSSVSYPAVEPMLTTKWDQRYPYNANCPMIDNYRCATGCVATAMAQVMYYHHKKSVNKVTKRIPSYWYEDMLVNSIPKNSKIDWDNMLDVYQDQNYTDEQAQAVANLMLYCGTSLKMKYETYGSATSISDIPDILSNYFGYQSSECIWRDTFETYSDEEWLKMVCEELLEGNPIIYGGTSDYSSLGSHCFVIDGYDGNGYVHINWGWGGRDNAFFLLSAVENYDLSIHGFIMGTYTNGQCAIFGAKPSEESVPRLKTVKITLNSDTLIHEKNSFGDDDYYVSLSCEVENITEGVEQFDAGFYLCNIDGDPISEREDYTHLNYGLTTTISDYVSVTNDINRNAIYKIIPKSSIHYDYDFEMGYENIQYDAIRNNANEDLYVTVVIKDGKSKLYIGKPDFSDDIVEFKDEEAKRVCLNNNWDIDEDGELSKTELDFVTDKGYGFDWNKHLVSFDELRFFNNLYRIGDFDNDINLKSIAIPKNVEYIESFAFENAKSLTSITIPSNVTSIGKKAFNGCESMTFVKVNWQQPITILESVFSNDVYENAILYVPHDTKSAYETAVGWKNFTRIVEFLLGDVNNDGKVNISDVTQTVSHILGNTPDNYDESVADMNDDGFINISDITLMVKAILGTDN